MIAYGNNIREIQIVNFTAAIVTGSAGTVKPTAQIDHRCIRMVCQVILYLPCKVILPHGNLQRSETLHQAVGFFLHL